MKKSLIRLFVPVFLLAALLTGCTGKTQTTGPAPTSAAQSEVQPTDQPISATPNPAATNAPAPSPTPALIECNVYVNGQALAHRAFVDPTRSAAMMVPLSDFVQSIGAAMENNAAALTLHHEALDVTVVIEDIYADPPICLVNGAQGAMTASFVSRGSTVYAPLDMLTSWFSMEWTQNAVGDVLVNERPVVENPEIIATPEPSVQP